MPLSWNLGTITSWNPLGHSRPVMGLLYLFTQPTTSGPHHTQVQDSTSVYNCKHHHRCSEKISGFFLVLLHNLLNCSVSSRNTLTEHDIVLLNKNEEELEDSWFHFSAYPPGRCQQYSINSSKCGQCYKHRYDPSHVAIQAVGKCLWRQQNNSDYAALSRIVEENSYKRKIELLLSLYTETVFMLLQ